VLGAAIAERHGSEDEPDPTPTTCDGRDGVEPTWLTSHRRVKQPGSPPRYSRHYCDLYRLTLLPAIRVSALAKIDLLREVAEFKI
jgi:hypothetical protein